MRKDEQASQQILSKLLIFLYRIQGTDSIFKREEYFLEMKVNSFLVFYTRSPGCYVPLLLAPAEGSGALLGAFSPVFSSRRCQTKRS